MTWTFSPRNGNQEVLPVAQPTSFSRQIKFLDPNEHSDNGWRDYVKRSWILFKARAFSTSTGSPSDGLGGNATSTTDSSGGHRMSLRQEMSEDQAWAVDEVVVSGEDPDEKYSLSEKGTSTETRRTDSANSTHGGGNGTGQHSSHTKSYYQPSFTSWVKYRAIPAIRLFFFLKFEEPDREAEYRAMAWWSSKPLAFWASLLLVLNWALYLGLNLQSTQNSLYAQICYYGGLTALTVPLPFFVAYNVPKHYKVFFQLWFCVAVWFCAYSELIQTRQCHFFSADNTSCRGKDFLAMNYYATGLPAIMMFIISERIYNAIAQIIWFILVLGLVIPIKDIYARNLIAFAIFSIFLQALHYNKEVAERRIFMMNYQLKLAYQGQDKARIKETRANNAKKRFASYIFHEVRVPLNTATLAFQNLQTENVFKNMPHLEVEVEALEASLSMMQQVLNDALDFHKMDAGRFDSNPRPFQLHRIINSTLRSIDVTAHAQQLKLIVNLDPAIDSILSPPRQGGSLWVVGDELRLRQTLTNLTSNAVKFSAKGGEVEITTKLVKLHYHDPRIHGQKSSGDKRPSKQSVAEEPKPKSLTFRLEVKDSGPGVKPSDMVEGGLFQPFVQTSVGISSGKGTGLGLAIVRQIVARSGGRLGVQSRRGEGATFWIELTYPFATPDEIANTQQQNLSLSQISPSISSSDTGPYHSFVTSVTTNEPLISAAITSQSSTHTKFLPQPQPPPEPIPSNPPVPQDLLVLVVDDDPLTRTLMKRMLTKLGCTVNLAENGQEFLDHIMKPNAPNYDMICLDNYMPKVTGEQAVAELRALGRTDLVIGCTGNALSEDQSSYLTAGADRVLTKPIMLKDLKAALELARRRKLDRS